MVGKTYRNEERQMHEGENLVTFNLEGLQSGVYFLEVQSVTGKVVKELVVAKYGFVFIKWLRKPSRIFGRAFLVLLTINRCANVSNETWIYGHSSGLGIARMISFK